MGEGGRRPDEGYSGGMDVWRYGCIALVVLERSSGTQLVFLKRLDLQPSAEDDNKGAEDDGDIRGRVVVLRR